MFYSPSYTNSPCIVSVHIVVRTLTPAKIKNVVSTCSDSMITVLSCPADREERGDLN